MADYLQLEVEDSSRIELNVGIAVAIVLCALLVEVPHLILEFLVIPFFTKTRAHYYREYHSYLPEAQERERRNRTWRVLSLPILTSWLVIVFLVSVVHGFGISSERTFRGTRRPYGTHFSALRLQDFFPPREARTQFSKILRCLDPFPIRNGSLEVVDVRSQSIILDETNSPSYCTGRNGSSVIESFRYHPNSVVGIPTGPRCPEFCSSADDCMRQFGEWPGTPEGVGIYHLRCDNAEKENSFSCRVVGNFPHFCEALNCFDWWLSYCDYSRGNNTRSTDHAYVSAILGTAPPPPDNVDLSVFFDGSYSPEHSVFEDMLVWNPGFVYYRDLVERSYITSWALVVCLTPTISASLIVLLTGIYKIRTLLLYREADAMRRLNANDARCSWISKWKSSTSSTFYEEGYF